jgi:hypothetical protein
MTTKNSFIVGGAEANARATKPSAREARKKVLPMDFWLAWYGPWLELPKNDGIDLVCVAADGVIIRLRHAGYIEKNGLSKELFTEIKTK